MTKLPSLDNSAFAPQEFKLVIKPPNVVSPLIARVCVASLTFISILPAFIVPSSDNFVEEVAAFTTVSELEL